MDDSINRAPFSVDDLFYSWWCCPNVSGPQPPHKSLRDLINDADRLHQRQHCGIKI